MEPPISAKSFWFSFLTIGYCVLIVLPIYLDVDSTMAKIITTVFGSIPILATSLRAYVVYIKPAFFYSPKDIQSIHFFSFILTVVAWLVSWATIYTIFWVWDREMYVDVLVRNSDNAYDVFEYFIAGAVGSHVADTPPYLVASNSHLAILISFQGFVSSLLISGVIPIIIVMGYDRVKKSREVAPQTAQYASQVMYPQGMI